MVSVHDNIVRRNLFQFLWVNVPMILRRMRENSGFNNGAHGRGGGTKGCDFGRQGGVGVLEGGENPGSEMSTSR